MEVVLSTWGKFHTFHLAREMERMGWLKAVFSTYPAFHLKKEGIPAAKLVTNPWLHSTIVAKWRLGWQHPAFDRFLLKWADRNQQKFIARNIPACDVFVGLSGAGLAGGRIVQARGGKWICDRSSSHIGYFDDLMSEEFARFGQIYRRSDPWQMQKEFDEYAECDRIVVPSEFSLQSFLERGFPRERLVKIPFGSDLGNFRKVADPQKDVFTISYCGQVSFRKGIPYLLEAFRRVRHPRKRLVIIGGVQPEIKGYLARQELDGVEFMGIVPHARLAEIYSRSNVFAMASIEEGMAKVQSEAMACGIPVVSTFNAGASDIVTDGVEGFIVPIRDPAIMADRLQMLADDPVRCEQMGANALERIRRLGGWTEYGQRYRDLCLELKPESRDV